MKKYSSVFFGLGCLSLIGGYFSYAYSTYTGALPTNKTITIGLDLPEPTGFYVNVYRVINDSEQLITAAPLVVNPDPEKNNELMIADLQLQKDDKIKATDNTNWYGTSTSYSHNISVNCSTTCDIVSDTGDYYAVQTGTYDIYVKFTDSTYKTYDSTYVNVDDTRTIYVQDSWDDSTDPEIHYWGSNVRVSPGSDNYKVGTQMKTQFEGHDMYKFIVPSLASSFNIHYQDKWSNNMDFDNATNAYQVYWDNGMKIQAHNWANPL